MGLQKSTRIHESISLLIREEFFNAMNHANFSSPSGNYSSSSFGRVTSAGPGRVGQVSMKFLW